MKKFLFLIAASFLIASCGVFTDVGGNTQSTTQVVASPFISALYGTSSKTLSLNVTDIDHIAWMSLDQSGDYNYFKVESYTYGGKTITNSTGTSSEVFKNISLSASSSSSSKTMQIVMSYTPSTAITADNKPHEATLNIAYDLPVTGAVAVTLEGYTQGIAESKCAGAASATQKTYTFKDNKLDFYLCDDNSPLVEANTDITTKTNHAEITMDTGSLFTFYQVDDQTLCILGASTTNTSLAPSIPNFDFTGVSKAAADIIGDSIPISLESNSQAACTVSSAGEILCDQDISLSKLLGTVSVSPLTLTNGTTDPTSDDCNHFPEETGSGDYNTSTDSLKLIAWGYIIPDSIVDSASLQGGNALVVVEINLDPVQ